RHAAVRSECGPRAGGAALSRHDRCTYEKDNVACQNDTQARTQGSERLYSMIYFDPWLMLWIAPALLLAFVAQIMVKSAYARARQVPARMSGMAAARRILDQAGLTNIHIEQVPGTLSDHYDPRHKVLRLSQ